MIMVRMILKQLCMRILTRNVSTLDAKQNRWSSSCLELYCGKNAGRKLVLRSCHHSLWSPNVSRRVLKLLCEGRRSTALPPPKKHNHHTELTLRRQNEEHSPHQREDLDASSSLDFQNIKLHPSLSERDPFRETDRRGTHFCIADHEPTTALKNTSNHCLRCKGTFQKLTKVSEINVTLSGCGFLGTYYVGVYEVLKKNGGSIFSKIRRWGGASAGALSAALITCYPDNPRIGLTVAQNIVEGTRNNLLGVFSPSFKLKDVLHTQLQEHLPKDAHELANGNLYISMTDPAKFQNEIITEFATREELIEALLCSCHIPYYSGSIPPEYKGKKYLDGGLTGNLPVYPFSGATIFVSPFSGCQHICPKDENWFSFFANFGGHRIKLNSQNIKRLRHGFLRPSVDNFKKYYEVGVQDTTKYLKKNDCYEETVTREGDNIY